jgi:nitronate monooxygenase
MLGTQHPILMAPMFLVSNEEMMIAGMKAGIAASFPSLNYRDAGSLEALLTRLNAAHQQYPQGSYGVNLIVQKTNPLYYKHLAACVAARVPFYITSLGNPQEVIEAAHGYGAKVCCDVTNMAHAKKVVALGADALIAVSAGAGGHAGNLPMHVLVPALRKTFPHIPIIAAGGIADGVQMASAIVLGADMVSIGTRFIATPEATVSSVYKNAIVDARMEDIVLTEKLSGTPCNIINTPTAQKLGYKQSRLQKWLSKNPRTKKYYKMLVQWKGMNRLQKSATSNPYQQLWSAGQSVEMVNEIESIPHIVEKLMSSYQKTIAKFAAISKT